MRLCLSLILLGCSAPILPDLAGECSEPPLPQAKVCRLLAGHEFDGYRQLVEAGEKAFPIYQEVLSDPKAQPYEVARILNVLCDVKADRRHFVDHAVQGLAHPNSDVRWMAVRLLEQIGTVREASPVVALLSDGAKVADKPIVYSAAKTLAAIGGPREVVAMDAWLLGASHRDDAHLRHHVKQCRDALQKRLTDSRAKDKS